MMSIGSPTGIEVTFNGKKRDIALLNVDDYTFSSVK